MVVNDGSTDGTLQAAIDAFDLVRADVRARADSRHAARPGRLSLAHCTASCW